MEMDIIILLLIHSVVLPLFALRSAPSLVNGSSLSLLHSVPVDRSFVFVVLSESEWEMPWDRLWESMRLQIWDCPSVMMMG